jgi:hypothetical protein
MKKPAISKKIIRNSTRTIISMILISIAFLVGCSSTGEKAARIIANDIIPKLTSESGQWRELTQDAINKLPQDIQDKVDAAIENAIDAAGAEFKCEMNFIREGARDELNRIVAELRQEDPKPPSPRFCNIWPNDTIKLDENFQPVPERYFRFGGYNLIVKDNMGNYIFHILLESEDGTREDITNCCLDNPHDYLITINLSKITFKNEHQRIIVKFPNNEERSVGIDFPAPLPPIFPVGYWTPDFSDEDPAQFCTSGFAVNGIACFGDHCDNLKLSCSPYLPGPDDSMQYWTMPWWISEETPHNTYANDKVFLWGMQCNGDDCDHILLTYLDTPKLINKGQCHGLDYVSEEHQNWRQCEGGSFAAGLTCRGDYCDEISLICCRAGY